MCNIKTFFKLLLLPAASATADPTIAPIALLARAAAIWKTVLLDFMRIVIILDKIEWLLSCFLSTGGTDRRTK